MAKIGAQLRRHIQEGVGDEALKELRDRVELSEAEVQRPWQHKDKLQKKLNNVRELDIADLFEGLFGASVRQLCGNDQDWNALKELSYRAQNKQQLGLPLSEAEVQSQAFQLLTQAKLFTTMQAIYELTPAVYEKLFGVFDSPYKQYDHQIPSDAPTIDFVPEGKEYPTAQLVDRFCKTKALKFGARIELTRETMIADRTGQVVAQAEGLAQSAKYREDELAALAFQDTSNGTIVSDPAEADAGCYYPEGTRVALYRTAVGATKPTYETAINKVTGNTLVHWDNLAAVIKLLRGMKNPRSSQYIQTIGDTAWIVIPFALEQRAGLLTAFGNGALTVIDKNVAAGSESIQTRAPDPIKQLGVSTIQFLVWNKLAEHATPSSSTWYFTGMPQKQFRKHQRWPTEFGRATQAQLGGDDFKRDIIVAVRGGFNCGFRSVDSVYCVQSTA